ncbi:hypothetical protein SAMN05421538_101100 [Paracoccus isoporae]|uniref:Uncharacterized protein n=1 Tax=Paracoccus isoporae TaxID=591205 RepID=A0A1G6SV18_9RHOB|nr:hypothetical protein [Paracoccus isoporae]SDD20619.1 hypothetical protein SAMN05421538_101100 [Paracoccus isoporae]
MTSFAESEKRLIAALGRIDRALEAGPAAADQPERDGESDESAARITALRDENTALKRRLAEAGEDATRLARANEMLAAENATLTKAGGGEAEAALRAEIEALKAARAAEIAALEDIMASLETFAAEAPRASDAPYAEDVAPAPGDVVAFDQSEG